MKKIYWLILILFICVEKSPCQITRFGMFFNTGVSWLTSDNPGISSGSKQPDFNFGIIADKYFAPNYIFSYGIGIHSLEGALTYHNSTTFSSDGTQYVLSPNTQVNYSLEYLHFPLDMKFRTVQINKITYYAQMGLDPMLNVKSNANFSTNQQTYSNVGMDTNTSFMYLGYDISVGLEYKIIANTAFMVGFEYMNGFSNIISQGAGNTTLNCLEIRLGMFF